MGRGYFTQNFKETTCASVAVANAMKFCKVPVRKDIVYEIHQAIKSANPTRPASGHFNTCYTRYPGNNRKMMRAVYSMAKEPYDYFKIIDIFSTEPDNQVEKISLTDVARQLNSRRCAIVCENKGNAPDGFTGNHAFFMFLDGPDLIPSAINYKAGDYKTRVGSKTEDNIFLYLILEQGEHRYACQSIRRQNSAERT